MAFHAVVNVTNSLFSMISSDACGRVLVAAVAGIAVIVVSGMAGNAFNIVIPIEQEQFVMVEGGGLPGFLGVALLAVA